MKLRKFLKILLLGPLIPLIGATSDNEVKFANTQIFIDNELVAKITSFGESLEIAEENITGSEDFIAGTDVLREKYTSISVGQTVDIEGIVIETSAAGPNDGQSELKDAAEEGKEVVMKQTRNTGYGNLYTGFFTSYEENASTSEVYKFSGTFRVNSVTKITPGS